MLKYFNGENPSQTSGPRARSASTDSCQHDASNDVGEKLLSGSVQYTHWLNFRMH